GAGYRRVAAGVAGGWVVVWESRDDRGGGLGTGWDILLARVVGPPAPPDCNTNGTLDECDIATGASEDCSGTGVPDECELGDSNGDGAVDLRNFADFQVCFPLPGPPSAACCLFDFEPDGDVDLDDYSEFYSAITGPNP
ncbi:MAG: hypothetical protein GY778_21715, partial [bacterium]|nr:hypothetical protein [bacterium]